MKKMSEARWKRFDAQLERAMRALHDEYEREQPQSRCWVWRAFDLAGAVFAGRRGEPLAPWGGARASDGPDFDLEAWGGGNFFDCFMFEGFLSWNARREEMKPIQAKRVPVRAKETFLMARAAFHHEAAPLYEGLRQAELAGVLADLPDDFFKQAPGVLRAKLKCLTERALLSKVSASSAGSLAMAGPARL